MTEHDTENAQTRDGAQTFEAYLLAQTKTWGPHSVRFRGTAAKRVAECSCGGWGRSVAMNTADGLINDFESHLASVQGRKLEPDAVAAERAARHAAAPPPPTPVPAPQVPYAAPRVGSTTAAGQPSSITQLFMIGLALIVICGALAAVLLPHAFGIGDIAPADLSDTLGDSSGSPSHSGAMFGFIVTALLAWGGQIMVLVALIAWGVRLGNDASQRRQAA